MDARIAIVGDRNLAHRAHEGIERSLDRYREEEAPGLRYEWIGTADIAPASVENLLRAATGIWCAPASPYASTEGALLAIRHARVHDVAFLGTCGGFQHALMEYVTNVLGRPAEHQEANPDARAPLISKLSCSLAGASGRITATPGSGFAELLGGATTDVEYNCNYGLNPGLVDLFAGSPLRFVAHDETGQIRAFRLDHQPFYVGTLFQPERRIFAGTLHPLVRAFGRAAEARP